MDGWLGEDGKDAWVLFDFQGEKEGNELSVQAHSHIQILSHALPSPTSTSPPPAALASSPDSSTTAVNSNNNSTTEGWSLALVPATSQIGLIPQSYFTYSPPALSQPTANMLPRSVPIVRPADDDDDEEDDDGEQEPPSSFTQAAEVVPQTTGGFGRLMYASKIVREGVLPGGRNVNRFSTFVVSGAEDFILSGPPSSSHSPSTPTTSLPKGGSSHFKFGSTSSTESGGTVSGRLGGGSGVGEADRHFVETGPSWRVKTPPFQLEIHSPSKRKSNVGLSEYTIYYITSTFTTTTAILSSSTSLDPTQNPSSSPPASTEEIKVTVERRFSNFLALQSYLRRKFPSLAIPPLPEKQYSGRFSDDFIEARRGDLERWMRRVTRHPVVRYSDGVVGFLGVEECEEWDQMYPTFSEDPHVGPHFYANIFHPAYNLDLEDASSSISRFSTHINAVGRSVQRLREVVSKTREGEREQALNRRALATGLLGLITSKPIGSKAQHKHSTEAEDSDEEEDGGEGEGRGLMNSEGGWCWREGCDDCLRLTKAMQGAADRLMEVAELEEKHASTTLLQTQEALKDVAHPATLYAPVVETHRATLSRYAEAVAEEGVPSLDNTISFVGPSDEIAARCETVLNSTMAETSHYHDSKVEDFKTLTTSYLDSEIDHLTSVLSKLVSARQVFDQPTYDELSENGPRLPSRYESDLSASSSVAPRPLVQPSPHVFDSISSTLRPVSMAVSTLGESLWSFGSSVKGRAVSSGDSANGRLSRWLW
ncbi:hypothetical protein BDY24DRAFT_387978 [Mrakia frigida]|uniref:uncharacterized protein n=1 Tax=Mrakia frigida TaxID=29902 RepID=UPI003FCBF9CF